MADKSGKTKRDHFESHTFCESDQVSASPLSECRKDKSIKRASNIPDDDKTSNENANFPPRNTSCDHMYVDGCMNKHTEGEAWASVSNKDRKDLVSTYKHLFSDLDLKTVETRLVVGIDHDMRRRIGSSSDKSPVYQYWTVAAVKFSDVSQQQNNGAELVSLVMALRIVKSESFRDVTIYSDSRLMVDFWSVGKVNPSTANKMDPRKKALVEECTELRKHCESQLGCKILFVSGKDNKADLGWHK